MKKRVLATVMALLATPAFAHAHLVSVVPANGATVTAPASLVLTFSEGLVANFTGIVVTGPGGVAAIAASSLDPQDDKVLDVTLTAPLAAGSYSVAWHALSTDGHKTEGTYAFTVK